MSAELINALRDGDRAALVEECKEVGYALDGWAVETLITYGHDHCLDLAEPVVYETCFCATAAFYGHLACLRFLHEHGCPWSDTTTLWAAETGHVDCLRYAYAHGCPCNVLTVTYAAHGGRLECLAFLHHCGIVGDETTTAAASHDPACLRFLHERGCPWDEQTTACAAETGCLESLAYAHEHGCPISPRTCALAAQRGSLACLVYAYEHGCPLSVHVCNYAWACNHPACFEYAHRHGCPYDPCARSFYVRRVLLPKWRGMVRARGIFYYWYDRAGRAACAEGGEGRKRDREAYELELEA